MAATYRSTGIGTAPGTNDEASKSCTIAKPAGLAVGDLMVAYLRRNVAADPVTVPTGWTLLTDRGTSNYGAWIYTKYAEAADVAASSFVWAWSAQQSAATPGWIHAFSGAFGDVDFGAFSTGDSGTAIAIPSLTTQADDTTVALLPSIRVASGTLTAPESFTEQYEGRPTTLWNGAIATLAYPTAGTETGVINYNATASGVYNVGIALGIRPAAAGDPPTGVWASYDGTSIKVTWTKVPKATGYKVYKAAYKGNLPLVDTLGDVDTWDDPEAAAEGYTYYYYIKAVRTGYPDSAKSNTASVTIPTQMARDTGGPWLFDRNRTTIALLPDFYALVTRSKFGSHSEWSGKFPPDAYAALSTAYFCQVADEDELYLVEKVTLHTSPQESYVEASGRSAAALLHQRTFLTASRWTGETHGAIVQSIINDFDASGTYEQVPVYRFVNTQNNDHLYTLYPSEGFAYPVYRYEGIAWWYEPTHNAVDVYRLYNAATGQHFYTISESERDTAIGDGWTYEGIAFPASTSGTPVYRFLRGDWHFYTMSTDERDWCIAAGWTDEGVGFYIADLVETRADREIPGLKWGTGETLGTAVAEYQAVYGDVGDTVLDLLAAGNLGITAHLSGTDVVIDVFAPSTADEVLYGDAYDNAAGSTLTRDVAAYANYAVVIGQGGVRADVDLRDASGMTQADAVRVERRELFVDGSSLDPSGYTGAQYQDALAAYGRQKLADTPLVEYADADIEASLDVGQMVWYDNGSWSALLMCSEVETSREGGTVSYRITMGEPPLTLRQSVRRLL